LIDDEKQVAPGDTGSEAGKGGFLLDQHVAEQAVERCANVGGPPGSVFKSWITSSIVAGARIGPIPSPPTATRPSLLATGGDQKVAGRCRRWPKQAPDNVGRRDQMS
jgi:hypothetical protein